MIEQAESGVREKEDIQLKGFSFELNEENKEEEMKQIYLKNEFEDQNITSDFIQVETHSEQPIWQDDNKLYESIPSQ